MGTIVHLIQVDFEMLHCHEPEILRNNLENLAKNTQ
uniref:Uncharacterized protein n=1 Tax=Rhizophora mucronata TaxID=61149 RepID=A0A2P2Q0H4_RHIMU